MLDHRYKSTHEYCLRLRAKSINLGAQIEDVKAEKARLGEEKKRTKDQLKKKMLTDELQKVTAMLHRLVYSKSNVDSEIAEIESEL